MITEKKVSASTNFMPAHSKDSVAGESDINGMRTLLNSELKTSNATIKEMNINTMSGLSWFVLGIAAHLAGDIYAHRTILPKSSLGTNVLEKNRINKSDFINWEVFRSRANNEVIEFRDIRCYMKEKSVIGMEKNQKYEDNINFFNSRYVSSAGIINNLIAQLKKKSAFNVNSVMVNGVSFNSDIKLNNFDAYSQSAGYTSTSQIQARSSEMYCVNTINRDANTLLDYRKYTDICHNENDHTDYAYALC